MFENDDIMQGLVDKYGELGFEQCLDPFVDLVRAIVGQQLSVRVADVIWGRVEKLLGDVTPESILEMAEEELRAVGLSWGKVRYVRNLANAVSFGDINMAAFGAMTDEEVIKSLTTVKGIGRWTAEMFLMFTLGRPDVFSHGDLGLRTAMRNLYDAHTRDEIEVVSHRWSPNRSLACLYLWKTLDN